MPKDLNKYYNGKRFRGEIHSGPDEFGRYQYTIYWMACYHPGHPDGEHRLAERGQEYLADPHKIIGGVENVEWTKDKIPFVFP